MHGLRRSNLLQLLIAAAAAVSVQTASASPVGKAPTQDNDRPLSLWLEQHRQRPVALRAFLQEMPKGADQHSHLSGAVYAEEYLQWAAAQGDCFRPSDLQLVEAAQCRKDASLISAAALAKHPKLYAALLDRWSTRDVSGKPGAGHADFFSAFQGFSALSSNPELQAAMVAAVANRAAAQSILYLELMLSLDGEAVRALGRAQGWQRDWAAMRTSLLQQGISSLAERGRMQVEAVDQQVAKELNCHGTPSQPGCQVLIRYLEQTKRTEAPEEVFAQFLYAFELASRSERVVGINLVGPEDHPIAQRDYSLQMRMLQFLRQHYPSVGIALHAGEVTTDLVPPAQMAFHIREAIELGGARRIGHGVAIGHERNAAQLLALMAQNKVLVELCLTSNEVILGVKDADHPLLDYQAAAVPIALASDDEGVLRTDLSEQFVLAVQRYGLNYSQLKQLARNSLEYSFLPGQSLWGSVQSQRLHHSCALNQPGSNALRGSCAAFLAGSAKARQQWLLEGQFQHFEAEFKRRSTKKPPAEAGG